MCLKFIKSFKKLYLPTYLTFSLFIFSESNFYLVSFFFTLKNFFKISYNVGSLKFSLPFCLFEKLFILLSFLKNIFLCTEIKVDSLFCQQLEIVSLSSGLHYFWQEVCIHSCLYSLIIMCLFFLWWFEDFLCITDFQQFDVHWCVHIFLVMWVYYFHQIWKKGHFFFQIIFTVYPLPPSRFQLHIGRQLDSILQVIVTLFMDFKIFPLCAFHFLIIFIVVTLSSLIIIMHYLTCC